MVWVLYLGQLEVKSTERKFDFVTCGLCTLREPSNIFMRFIYYRSDAPHYPIGNSTNAAILLSGALMTLIVRVNYMGKNRAIDRRNRELAAEGVKLTDTPLFRYTL